MNLSRTAAALLGVLLLLIGVSVYLWFWVGTGKAEVDPRIAGTLQNFTCEKCGHNFAMTMAEVSQMRRNRGQICCPKCGEGGAHKDLMNRGSTSRSTPPAKKASPGKGSGKVDAATAAGGDRAAAKTPKSAPGPTSAPVPAGDTPSRSAVQ